jgi:hypothetical protein
LLVDSTGVDLFFSSCTEREMPFQMGISLIDEPFPYKKVTLQGFSGILWG